MQLTRLWVKVMFVSSTALPSRRQFGCRITTPELYLLWNFIWWWLVGWQFLKIGSSLFQQHSRRGGDPQGIAKGIIEKIFRSLQLVVEGEQKLERCIRDSSCFRLDHSWSFRWASCGLGVIHIWRLILLHADINWDVFESRFSSLGINTTKESDVVSTQENELALRTYIPDDTSPWDMVDTLLCRCCVKSTVWIWKRGAWRMICVFCFTKIVGLSIDYQGFEEGEVFVCEPYELELGLWGVCYE